MNRAAVHIGLAISCIALIWCARLQHNRLNALRADEQRLLIEVNSSDAAGPGAPSAQPGRPAEAAVSAELLKLRSTLTRLEARKRELAGVAAENERLKQRLASRASLSAPLPTGQFTRETARFVGYNSPEDTVQSAFWAMQNRDVTNLVQAFAPEVSNQVMQQVQTKGVDGFLGDRPAINHIAILERTAMPDGSVELSIQTSETEKPEKTRFYLINGQWKIGEPPK